MSNLVYIDGTFYNKEDAKISVYDHGLLYGDGVFEGIRVYDGVIFRLDEHIDRLFDGFQYMNLNHDYTKEQVKQICIDTVKKNLDIVGKDQYIRLVVTRGMGNLGINPFNCTKPSIICICDKIALFPAETYATGVDVMVSSYRRTNPDALNPQMKSLNYMTSVMAKMEAHMAGKEESILLDTKGYVCEGTGDNIFIIKNGVLITPPCSVGSLGGITRNTILQVAERIGIPVQEKLFTIWELYTCDECFLTGTAAEVMPVRSIAERKIGVGGTGEITKKILEGFGEYVKEYNANHADQMK